MGAKWGGLGDDRTRRLRPVSFLSVFNTCFVYFLQNDFFSPHYRLGCEAVGGVGEVSPPCPCSIHSQERFCLAYTQVGPEPCPKEEVVGTQTQLSTEPGS